MDRLVATDLHKRLGTNAVLKGVTLELGAGEVVALLGPSGSGKTTLLRALAGLDHPDSGTIALGREVLFDARRGIAVPAERRNLGLVFQSYALWPHRTVGENVAYALRLRGVPGAEVQRRVRAALDQIGLRELADRHPHQLSGGQQQRVALARAIVYEPRVLLLDEPLSNLDAKLREEARAWLRRLIERLGISAVCVTHDQLEALAIADRVLLLHEGRIDQEGTPEDIYQHPVTLFAAEFMGSNDRVVGPLREVRGALGRIEAGGGSIWGQVRGPLAVGQAAVAVIRVERTSFRGEPGENALPARVETALYLGERWDCVLDVGGQRVRTWQPVAPASREGWLHFPPEALWIFPAPPSGADSAPAAA